jgi:branched-chain amino acid transport system substrate-binding protein
MSVIPPMVPENNGIQIVERQHFNTTDVSVSAQIEKIKAAQPQALIAWSTGAPIATVFKGIVQGGLEIPVATTNANQTYAQMEQYKSFLPKELYIPTSVFLQHKGQFNLDPKVEERSMIDLSC